MEFVKLEKPIKITKPIPVEFTEIYISPDIRWNFFKSVVDTVKILFDTKEGVTLFALREFIQNAIDQEIIRTGDFLNAYKNVKFEEKEGYYVIESQGDMPEESFELGYSTKVTYGEKGECCLIGRFGIGFKQGIGALNSQHYRVIIQTNGHSYTFAGICNNEIKFDNITGDCRIAILRGPSNVKGKTIIYAEGAKLTTNLLWDSPYRVSKSGGKVYHNGLYSGNWSLPYSVNLCCVDADEYRTVISESSTRMRNLIAELYSTLTQEEHEIIIDSIMRTAMISDKAIEFNYPGKYGDYFTDFDDIVEAIIRLAKKYHINIIIVASEYEKSISETQFVFKDLPFAYMVEIVQRIRKKGYDAYTPCEWRRLTTAESLIKMSIPQNELPEDIKAGIILGKWLFNVALTYELGGSGYDLLHPAIEDTPIYVLKDETKVWDKNDLGMTTRGTTYGKELKIFLAPPNVLYFYAEKEMMKSLAVTPREARIFTVATVVFHELIHAMYSLYQHGSFQWEMFFNLLIFHTITGEDVLKFLKNLVTISFHYYELLQGVKRIYGLSDYIIEPDVIDELRHTSEILGKIENGKFVIPTDEKPTVKMKVIREENRLEFKYESIE